MNQTQIQRLNVLDQRQKFNKRNQEGLIKLGCLAAAVLLNLWFWPRENNLCYYEATWLNKLFLLGVVLPELVIRLACLGFWNTTVYLQQRKMVIDVTSSCLYAAWFVLTLVYYDDFTPACYEPYPSYSVFLFTIEMLVILPQAFFVICMVSFLVIFAPCILYTVGKAYFDDRQRAQLKEQVVSSLTKISYGRIKFEGQNECSICLNGFEDDDLVTPLSCDIRHYFHYECIQQWMQMKNECPLCKAEIVPANLKELTKELKRLEFEANH